MLKPGPCRALQEHGGRITKGPRRQAAAGKFDLVAAYCGRVFGEADVLAGKDPSVRHCAPCCRQTRPIMAASAGVVPARAHVEDTVYYADCYFSYLDTYGQVL